MGLIKAAMGAAGSVMADQWKEYFYCEALPVDVLAVRGRKKVSGRSSNKGSDNVISNGSLIAVADGQCMLIVDQGKIVDVCAEPGEYTYDMSTEPSVFTGSLGAGISAVFKNIGKRFTFGGETPKEQRVYYFNTKEITGNKYGTPSPVPFRVVDERAGIDLDIGIRCFGAYSYRITNPLLFYTNVCGNVSEDYTRDKIDDQLKSELVPGLFVLHPHQQFVHAGIAGCFHAPFILLNQLYGRVAVIKAGLEYRQLFRIFRALFQIAHAQIAAEGDFSFVVAFLTGQDIQQGGFSRAVLGYQSDALSFCNTERYAVKKDQVAERLGQVFYL